MNSRPTLSQWLAVLAVWAMALYGLIGAPRSTNAAPGQFVRLAQTTPDAACRCLR